MEISRFFNSAPGDPRTYQASDFASYFGDVLTSGLLHTDKLPALEVKVDGTDLRTYVTPGKAIIQGYGYQNTSDLYLTHALPEATLDRIDRIVLRLDKRNQSRFIKLFVKQGEAAAAPVPPVLQRDEFIYELSLAQIRVRANTSTLQAGDLIDERLNEDLCGLVYSLISIPTSQFQAEWDAFMAGIQDSGFASAEELASHLADDVNHVRFADGLGLITKLITLNPSPTAYTNGMGVSFRNVEGTTNTSSVNININNLGNKPLLKSNGSAVIGTALKAESIYTIRYNASANGGTGAFILQGEGGSGNLQPNQALAGYTFTNDEGEQIGTGDPDLLPTNIRKGVNIFGVNGTLPERAIDLDSMSGFGWADDVQSSSTHIKPINSQGDTISVVPATGSPYNITITKKDANGNVINTVTAIVPSAYRRYVIDIGKDHFWVTYIWNDGTNSYHAWDKFDFNGNLLLQKKSKIPGAYTTQYSMYIELTDQALVSSGSETSSYVHLFNFNGSMVVQLGMDQNTGVALTERYLALGERTFLIQKEDKTVLLKLRNDNSMWDWFTLYSQASAIGHATKLMDFMKSLINGR